ncbi:MAG: hypothetical protein ABIJ09_13530 [Pseudomonadota bacterium]
MRPALPIPPLTLALAGVMLLASTGRASEDVRQCLDRHQAQDVVLEMQREAQFVRIEHICPLWSRPLQLQGVKVLATDLDEDAGAPVAVLRVELAHQSAFERRVRVGDRVGERWVVVAAGDGIVLFDDEGTLLAALDGRPVVQWRLTWHSPFSVAGLPAATATAPAAAPPGKSAKAAKVTAPAAKQPSRPLSKNRK